MWGFDAAWARGSQGEQLIASWCRACRADGPSYSPTKIIALKVPILEGMTEGIQRCDGPESGLPGDPSMWNRRSSGPPSPILMVEMEVFRPLEIGALAVAGDEGEVLGCLASRLQDARGCKS